MLQGGNGDYTFDAHARGSSSTPTWATVAFLLALFGFGAKAGILPLHVWLPEAHPAAPSPVSALMSGVMLKTAIYGLLRVTLDLIGCVRCGGGACWRWRSAWSPRCSACCSPRCRHDMKRLLAYSSIENIGIILAGFGLTLIFRGFGMGALAALALTATLYHCLNHACSRACCSSAPARCCTPPASAAWASWAA